MILSSWELSVQPQVGLSSCCNGAGRSGASESDPLETTSTSLSGPLGPHSCVSAPRPPAPAPCQPPARGIAIATPLSLGLLTILDAVSVRESLQVTCITHQ